MEDFWREWKKTSEWFFDGKQWFKKEEKQSNMTKEICDTCFQPIPAGEKYYYNVVCQDKMSHPNYVPDGRLTQCLWCWREYRKEISRYENWKRKWEKISIVLLLAFSLIIIGLVLNYATELDLKSKLGAGAICLLVVYFIGCWIIEKTLTPPIPDRCRVRKRRRKK